MTVASEILAEGKTKVLRPGQDSDEISVIFKDAATAFNGKKHAVIPGKGELNARISTLLFALLAEADIPSCYLRPGAQAARISDCTAGAFFWQGRHFQPAVRAPAAPAR